MYFFWVEQRSGDSVNDERNAEDFNTRYKDKYLQVEGQVSPRYKVQGQVPPGPDPPHPQRHLPQPPAAGEQQPHSGGAQVGSVFNLKNMHKLVSGTPLTDVDCNDIPLYFLLIH